MKSYRASSRPEYWTGETPQHTRGISSSRAVTLTELIVALAILSVITVGVVKIVNTFSSVWISGTARIDNYTKSRTALELIGRDLSNSIIRPDLPSFTDASGSTDFTFFTKWEGPVESGAARVRGDRAFSCVRYRVFQPAGNGIADATATGLQRGSLGYSFDAQLRFDGTSPPPLFKDELFPAGDYQLIGPGVIQTAIQYVRRDGTLTSDWAYDFANPGAPTNCVGVRCTLVVVDEKSLVQLTATDRLKELTDHFRVTPPNPVSPQAPVAELFRERMNDAEFFQSLPVGARNGIRVFERLNLLPHLQ